AVAVAVAIGLVVIACRRVESDARALVRSAQSLPSGPGATTTTQAAVLPELVPVSKAIAGTAAIVERRGKELIDQHEDVSRHDQRLRAVIERAVGPIVVFNVDGTVLYASASTVGAGGYCADEIVGQRRFEVVHPEDREMLRARYAEVVRTPGGALT